MSAPTRPAADRAAGVDVDPPSDIEPARRLLVLVYAMTAGVGWWAFHLVALAATAPAVCNGTTAWLQTAINATAVIGVGSAIAASVSTIRSPSVPGRSSGRSRFLGQVSLAFNVITIALVILESVPVYVLGACA